jgi:hypothetical protein
MPIAGIIFEFPYEVKAPLLEGCFYYDWIVKGGLPTFVFL